MDAPLKLLITDSSLILSEKGKVLVEQTYTSDEECFSIIGNILKNHKKMPIQCFFSGSRITSQSRSVEYTGKDMLTANHKTINLLVENAKHSFLEEYKELNLQIVSAEVVDILLNGYRVSATNNQKVSTVKVMVFFTAVPASYKKPLDVCLGHFASHCTITSFAWYQAQKIMNATKKTDFITCSAYECSTDISIMKFGKLFETITIPIGTMHVQENTDKGLPIDAFQLSLDKKIESALASLCNGLALPSSVYLMVSPAYHDAFAKAFGAESYQSVCFSEKGFEVTDMSSILKT